MKLVICNSDGKYWCRKLFEKWLLSTPTLARRFLGQVPFIKRVRSCRERWRHCFCHVLVTYQRGAVRLEVDSFLERWFHSWTWRKELYSNWRSTRYLPLALFQRKYPVCLEANYFAPSMWVLAGHTNDCYHDYAFEAQCNRTGHWCSWVIFVFNVFMNSQLFYALELLKFLWRSRTYICGVFRISFSDSYFMPKTLYRKPHCDLYTPFRCLLHLESWPSLQPKVIWILLSCMSVFQLARQQNVNKNTNKMKD